MNKMMTRNHQVGVVPETMTHDWLCLMLPLIDMIEEHCTELIREVYRRQ